MIVELKSRWTVGAQLTADAAGFGRVFEAEGENGERAVVKFVAKLPGAERELLFGDNDHIQAAPNIVPIWDTGEHAGEWAMVMPRADKSLRQHLLDAGGPLDLDESVEILMDVARALAGLVDVAVHRDLKPENVLLLNGTWCLADFGIARYAEAATDAATRKYSFTRPYAAPEQWRIERATSATDIYAFGVMAFELLAGHRPFPGPDFRDQHLHHIPPALSAGTPRLRVLVEECLIKAPEARPPAALVVQKLERSLSEPQSGGAARLAALNRTAVEAKALAHAQKQSVASEAERRRALAQAAERSFYSIEEQLRAVVEDEAPEAVVELNEGRGAMAWVASLKSGRMGMASVKSFDASPWGGPFDIVAVSQMTVHTQAAASRGYLGRSHALWFCDAATAGHYAWFEVAFMNFAWGGQPSLVPFALEPRSAEVAFNGVMGTTQLAWGPEELDRADLAAFVDRWIGWFADAGEGSLQVPGTMPEPGATRPWRRP